MGYKLRIAERAKEQIDQTIGYVTIVLSSPMAAKSILEDIEKVYTRLTYAAGSLPYCEDLYLRSRGYHKIALEHHRYVFLYKVDQQVVYIAGFFHMMENYKDKL